MHKNLSRSEILSARVHQLVQFFNGGTGKRRSEAQLETMLWALCSMAVEAYKHDRDALELPDLPIID